MAKMTKKKELFLAAIQANDRTPVETLDGTNFIEPQDGSKLELMPENEENNTVSGSINTQNPHIIGMMGAQAELNFLMRSVGDAAAPDWATVAQAAGLELASIEVGVDSYKYELSPSEGVGLALTLWHYGGSKETLGATLKKAGNLKFQWKISAEMGKAAQFNLTGGKGAAVALPSAGTQPTVTKVEGVTPAVSQLTKSIIGEESYVPLNFSFEGGEVVEQRFDGSEFGYGECDITDRKIKWSAQVYADSPDVLDPMTAMRAASSGVLSFNWGRVGEKMEISSQAAQIIDIKENYAGNIPVWDISGICIDNDLLITINADLTGEGS